MIQPKIICVVLAMLLAVPTAAAAIYVPTQTITKDVIVSQTINELADKLNKEHNKDITFADNMYVDTQNNNQESNYKLKQLGNFKVTAYCPCEKCNGRWAGQTASGVVPKEGITVAVDKKVIPLGTKLYIEGIGEVIAQDTGVKGKTIDLYMPTHTQAKIWGVKRLNVWIIN